MACSQVDEVWNISTHAIVGVVVVAVVALVVVASWAVPLARYVFSADCQSCDEGGASVWGLVEHSESLPLLPHPVVFRVVLYFVGLECHLSSCLLLEHNCFATVLSVLVSPPSFRLYRTLIICV